MPAHLTAPLPPLQLRERLEAARREGHSFDAAWTRALAAIVWPARWRLRCDWLAALEATRSEFEAAYYSQPTAFAEAAAELLARDDASRPATHNGDRSPLASLVA